MGANESRPRETRDGDGEEEIPNPNPNPNPDIFQALAAGAAVVGLGVAAWNAVRTPASSSSLSPLQHHQKRTFEFKVDGSVGEDLQDPYRTKKGGSGGVLRNEKGVFLCEFYQHLGKEADITAAEVTAIKGALEVFSNNKFKWVGQYDELIVANDNDSAVRLAKGEQDPSKYWPLLEEIKTLVSAIGEVDFIKIDREDNVEANALAIRGRKYLAADKSNPRVVSYM